MQYLAAICPNMAFVESVHSYLTIETSVLGPCRFTRQHPVSMIGYVPWGGGGGEQKNKKHHIVYELISGGTFREAGHHDKQNLRPT